MDQEIIKQAEYMFEGLKRIRTDAFPPPGTLSKALGELCSASNSGVVRINREILNTFATATVEMWLRSLHSFLISASLSEASPIWSSVSGYYASHYAIRGLAHLFGVFMLHNKGLIVYMVKENGYYCFKFIKKGRNDREHKFYWKYVSTHSPIAGDPFFYPNPDGTPESDVAHRDKANYYDHIDRFPIFTPLTEDKLLRRIDQISGMVFHDVPRPNADRFPDLASIQIVAYHRIIKFRDKLDEFLGTEHRFWKAHRNPSWCPKIMTFTVAEPVYLELYMR